VLLDYSRVAEEIIPVMKFPYFAAVSDDTWLESKTKTNEPSQTSIRQYSHISKAVPSALQSSIRNGIFKWIVKDCRPITTMADEGLIALMRAATGHESLTPPCYWTITEDIRNLYVKNKDSLRSHVDGAPAVSLIANFWTSS